MLSSRQAGTQRWQRMNAFSPARVRQSADAMPLPTLSPDVKAHLCSILEYVLRRYKNNQQFHTNTKVETETVSGEGRQKRENLLIGFRPLRSQSHLQEQTG